MIRVTIIEDARVINSIVPNPQENIRIAWAQENEFNRGYAVFTTDGEIKEVADKESVFELLVRATLNSLDLKGVKTAFSCNEKLFDELKKLGFHQEDNKCFVDIAGFFKPCGSCKKQ